MAGSSPTTAGVSPTTAGAAMDDAIAPLDIVQMRIKRELWRERASGSPLKSAYHAVARRLGVTARRVRAYHHNEVEADEVTAKELIAADGAWRSEMAALYARIRTLEGLAHDETAGSPRAVAPSGVDQAQQDSRNEGGDVARAMAAVGPEGLTR